MEINQRTIEKVMNAASACQVDNDRDAAILGGIVRCMIDRGKFDPTFVAYYTETALSAFKRPDNHRPSMVEVRRMVRAFQTAYEPPTEAAA